MAEYTSGQYKYLLLQRLRRSFSMRDQRGRAYTQSFFWALFEGVTVTEAAYNNFVSLMDEQLDYLAKKGIYLCENIPSKDVEDGSLLLIDAFAEIGIQLSISEEESGGYQAVFVKPGGETLTYTVSALGTNYFYINARAGTELGYAKASAAAYNLEDMTVEDGDELNPKVAGPGTWWSYAAATQAMTISGSGAYAGAQVDTQLGGGAYTTLIVGAEVSRLLAECMMSSEAVLVLLTPADGQITIDPRFNVKAGSCGGNGVPLDVYTDCAAAIQTLSGEDFAESITLHPLSDWEG